MLFTVVSMESLQTIKAILNNVISLRALNVIQKQVCFSEIIFAWSKMSLSASANTFIETSGAQKSVAVAR